MTQPSALSPDPTRKHLQRFVIKMDARVFAVPVEQVDWIESAANYVRLHVGAATHLVRATMRTVETSLDPRQFVRVHRNAIVNVARIQHFHMPARGSMCVVLRDGARVPLSRGYQGTVRKLMTAGAAANNSSATSMSADHPIT